MKYIFRNEKNTVKWWTDFIKILKAKAAERRTTTKFLESLSRQSADKNNGASEEIQTMLRKETRSAPVSIFSDYFPLHKLKQRRKQNLCYR